MLGPLVNVYGSWLHAALLIGLCLLLEPLRVLLVGLDQLDFFLGALTIRLILLILKIYLFLGQTL